MRSFYQGLATLNFLGVFGYMAGIDWLLWPLLFTAIMLFSDGVTNHSKSRLSALFIVGAPLNFMGVVTGGLTGIKPVLFMAMTGSILLLIAHWGDRTKPSAASPTSDTNVPK